MIIAPDPSSSRSALADWIEITAFLRGRAAGAGDLDSLLRLNSDNDRERPLAGSQVVEEEIAETPREDLALRVADEIGFRLSALGDDYPFEVLSNPLRVKLKQVRNDSSHDAYLFMLLMTACRDHRFKSDDAVGSTVAAGRTLFHICASLGVAGMIKGGNTFWFGWPRPDKSNFAAALNQLSGKLGFSSAKDPPPPGLPTAAKDDQIDVVGWRSYGDRRTGTLVVICQAATGNDWDGKSVTPHLLAFTDWFDRAPYRLATPCLAVPFPVHHEVDDRDDEDYEEAVFNALQRLNGRHGVMLDRLRITESVVPVINRPTVNETVGGFAGVAVFNDWIERLLPQIAAAA